MNSNSMKRLVLSKERIGRFLDILAFLNDIRYNVLCVFCDYLARVCIG